MWPAPPLLIAHKPNSRTNQSPMIDMHQAPTSGWYLMGSSPRHSKATTGTNLPSSSTARQQNTIALTQHLGMHSRSTQACTHATLMHALTQHSGMHLRHALTQHSGMHSCNTQACTLATLTHALTHHSCMHSRNTRACTHATLRHASRNCSICRTICITHNKNTHPGPDPGA